MAFNPFHWFRKHQKSFLAALAIFCMFIFVAQFGRGYDAFDCLLSLFGGGSRKDTTEVTRLYGTSVTVTELNELEYQRKMVQSFILQALFLGQEEYLDVVKPRLGRLKEASAKELREIIERFRNRGGQDPRIPSSTYNSAVIQQDLRELSRIRREVLQEDPPKVEAARDIRKVSRILETELWKRSTSPDTYFGGSFNVDGLLDFLVWRHQADRLGIQFTEADIREALNQECLSEIFVDDPRKDASKLFTLLGPTGYQNVTLGRIYQALGDEFRVRLAKTTLLGIETGAREYQRTGVLSEIGPAPITPDQFWNYYRDNRTELQMAMLALPVTSFVSQVTGEPSREVMERLFTNYSDVEPSPERDRPAFKEPRRVKVEWISASADAPYYQKKSAEAVRLVDAATQILACTGPQPGGFCIAALDVAVPLVLDPPIAGEYDILVREVQTWLDDTRQYDGSRPSDIGRLERPENAVDRVAQMLAAVGSSSSVLLVPSLVAGASAAHQADLSLRAAGAILTGSRPSCLSRVIEMAARFTRPIPPLSAVRSQLAERPAHRYASAFLASKLLEFKKGLQGLNPKDAQAYLATHAVPSEGILHHEIMPQACDRYEITDAPTLDPLLKVFLRTPLLPSPFPPGFPQGEQRRSYFPFLFFSEGPQLYRPTLLPDPEGASIPLENKNLVWKLLADLDPEGKVYLFWKTKDDKPSRPPTFDEARPKIVAAWRLQQARELARKKADVIAEAVRNRKQGVSGDRFLRDEAARLGLGAPFEPHPNVARLVPVESFRTEVGRNYEPYKFPESQIAYPRSDTVDKLLDSLKHPGDVMVLTDRPEAHMYVAVLIARDVPPQDKFFDTYRDAARLLPDALWSRFAAERQGQYARDLLRQLRSEATTVDEAGDYQVASDVRKKLERRESETTE
jgi:hypothetical protein